MSADIGVGVIGSPAIEDLHWCINHGAILKKDAPAVAEAVREVAALAVPSG